MHMHDWNKYRNQLFAASTGFGNLSPDTVKGYATLGGAGEKTGQLGAKTRELIALAVAVSLRCDGCIAVHAAAARKHGATKQEIAEALGMSDRTVKRELQSARLFLKKQLEGKDVRLP